MLFKVYGDEKSVNRFLEEAKLSLWGRDWDDERKSFYYIVEGDVPRELEEKYGLEIIFLG
ncbi:MAG: hypothetical protein DRP12_03820 [Candidatus Aenigmatarchaeota archaeon]|nr:MAG: hypothetical protein DRP12_03820 [Candidatus Aenigmarchaeota archaeon]